MSKKVSMRYLIDVAIGNPEPGIVNFNALYTVLQAISVKLDLEDAEIEVDSSLIPVAKNTFDSKSNVSSEQFMKHQVYDVAPDYEEEEQDFASKGWMENENSNEPKETHSSQPMKNRRTSEEHKVAFGRLENDNVDDQISRLHGAKEFKNLNIEQHIHCLYKRIEKVENFGKGNLNTDTEQSVNCLRGIVLQLHDKLDLLEKSVLEQRNNQHAREEDISACRIKLEYEKLTTATDALKTELDTLKDSINGVGAKNQQLKSMLGTNFNGSEDITRLDSQLTDLKANICLLNEKLKNLEEIVTKTDSFSGVTMVFESEISKLKTEVNSTTIQIEQKMLDEVAHKLDEIRNSKIDKTEAYELLSEKADYSLLHEKVSEEIMIVEHRKIKKQLAEITDYLTNNEEQIKNQIDGIKELVGDENIKDLLQDFKLKFNKDIQIVSDDLKKLSESKPDNDSAVSRIKDLTCLSCDQEVVMKAVEINNVPKFSDAHVSKSISPFVTFEVGKLRQIGKVGRFNDDDIIFELDKKFRHCGGVHTIITNKDRISKTRQPKNK